MSLSLRRLAAGTVSLLAVLAGTAAVAHPPGPPARTAPGTRRPCMRTRSVSELAGRVLLAGLLAGAGAVVTAAPAHAGGLAGVTRVAHWTAKDYSTVKSWHVACPAETVVIGGGAEIDGPDGGRLEMLRPNPFGNRFEARARMVQPRGIVSWRLIVYAVCAVAPPGLTYVAAESQSPSPTTTLRTAVATCPAGTKVLGLGAQAAKEAGRNVVLQWMYPNASLTSVVGMSHERPSGEDQEWTLAVYAVCGAVPSAEVGFTEIEYTTDHIVSVTSSCPGDGLRLTGPGFRYSGYAAYGDGWLHTLRPDASLGSMYLHGRRDADSTADWWPELYPVCV